jgi:CheY-like chemotaxis protein
MKAKVILLADDDADDVMLFKEALSEIDSSITCYTAENGEEALKLISGLLIDKPDVIFLDINMPLMNGWQFLSELKRDPFLEHIPVVMYSTSSYKSDIDKSFMLGAICFFVKPGSFRELKSILQIILSEGDETELIKKIQDFKDSRQVFGWDVSLPE